MNPVNFNGINRETIQKLAKDHAIINQALKMIPSPDYPLINTWEDALILMVIHLAQTTLDLRDMYLGALSDDVQQVTVAKFNDLSSQDRKKLLGLG